MNEWRDDPIQYRCQELFVNLLQLRYGDTGTRSHLCSKSGIARNLVNKEVEGRFVVDLKKNKIKKRTIGIKFTSLSSTTFFFF